MRHGTEKGSVTLGGRRVVVEKVRIRSVDGAEIPLETYEALHDPQLLTQAALERMIHDLSPPATTQTDWSRSVTT
ncbi:MAG: hypothetical protein K6T78_16130 [Alicyclobacillus sp.]|nr:hypothetical protein [Alicyclobacillus sp.]